MKFQHHPGAAGADVGVAVGMGAATVHLLTCEVAVTAADAELGLASSGLPP